jgi:hypothetical protein
MEHLDVVLTPAKRTTTIYQELSNGRTTVEV